MTKPVHLPDGSERNCRAKRNGIAQLMGHAAAPSGRIPGVWSHLHRVTEISICGVGIRHLSDRFPMGPAISALPTLSETAGNGHARISRPFRGLNRFLST